MTRVETEKPSLSGMEHKMPKLILTAAALLFERFERRAPATADPHDAMHATTRSRDATRRLRASRIHDPYFDLGPLDLTRRH